MSKVVAIATTLDNLINVHLVASTHNVLTITSQMRIHCCNCNCDYFDMILSVTCTILSQLRNLLSLECGSVSQSFDFTTSGSPYLGSIWALDIPNCLCWLSCFQLAPV